MAFPVACAGVGVPSVPAGVPTSVIGTLRSSPRFLSGAFWWTVPLKLSQPSVVSNRWVAPGGRVMVIVVADGSFWPATRFVLDGGATEKSPVALTPPLKHE